MRRLRQIRVPVARVTLGLFLAVWLNMAAQPCLMAMESPAEEPGCGHHSDCPHCPSADQTGLHASDDTDDRCTYTDSFDYDGRDNSVKLPDLVKCGGLLLLTDWRWNTPRRSGPEGANYTRVPPDPGVAPYLSFCHFRE